MTTQRRATISSGGGLMVWESNDLVRTATYEMSTREVKLLVVAISRIQQRSHDAFGPVVVTVRELSELLELKCDAVYSDIKDMAETLTGRVVRLYDPETRTHKWTNWCDVVYTEGSGCVQIVFRDALKPHLLQLAEYFVRYGLDNILRLSSAYHIRLYEFLKSWESFGKPRVVEMAELRRILGAESKGYDQYFVFNGSVLKPAAAAINKHTDVRFKYLPVKQGRAVSAVQFTIKSPPQPELPFERSDGVPPTAQALPPAGGLVSADAPGTAARSAQVEDDLFSRTEQVPPSPGREATQDMLGGEVAAYWNERMVNSPVVDTGSDRLKEVGRQITGDAFLKDHWREAIDVVSESKVWNGRGHRGRDGQPFHASFHWFLDHACEVADAVAARRQRLKRRAAPKPLVSPVQAQTPGQAAPAQGEAMPHGDVVEGLRKLRDGIKRH